MNKKEEKKMALYRKRPVVIEATQWFKNGDHPEDYMMDIENHFPNPGAPSVYTADFQRENNWEGQVVRYYRTPDIDGQSQCKHCGNIMHDHGWIDTLEGGHIVCPGDFVVTGVQDERYPVKPHIFEATYEPA